jgi:hypothetical protein
MSFLQVGLVGQPRFAATEPAVHSMFARADMSAPIEGAEQSPTGLGLSLTFPPVESADMEIFVRPDISVSMVGAMQLAFVQVESANMEMFATRGTPVSMVGAMQLAFVQVESANMEMFATRGTPVLAVCAHCLLFLQVEYAVQVSTRV